MIGHPVERVALAIMRFSFAALTSPALHFEDPWLHSSALWLRSRSRCPSNQCCWPPSSPLRHSMRSRRKRLVSFHKIILLSNQNQRSLHSVFIDKGKNSLPNYYSLTAMNRLLTLKRTTLSRLWGGHRSFPTPTRTYQSKFINSKWCYNTF